jgi:hypothetical protein
MSNDSCLVFDCAAVDYSQINRTTMRKARKQHCCVECGDPVLPGEQYEENTQIVDEQWQVYRTCLLCCRIRNDLSCGCFVFGDLREAIWDQMGFDYVTGKEDSIE